MNQPLIAYAWGKSLATLAVIFLLINQAYAAPVYTWIPWYSIPQAQSVLDDQFGEIRTDEVVSHVALQFWNIRSDGTLYNWNVSDAKIREMVDYVKAKNLKVGMAIVNIGSDETGYDSFDWTLVRPAAYGEHQDKFIKNILNIMDSLDMDDLNLDLEGEDAQGGPWTESDKEGYAGFVAKIADSLHARNKTLSIAAYGTPTYGAPNPTWFSSWQGKVDQIHTMNYTGAYWSAAGISGYPQMQKFGDSIGYTGEELLIGMPVWVNNWKGGDDNTGISNIDNLHFIKNCLPNNQGVTLWDISHPAKIHPQTKDSLWRQDSVWILLKEIADDTAPNDANCPNLEKPDWIIDDFTSSGATKFGGMVAASSDFWERTQAVRRDSSTTVLTLGKDYDMVAGNGVWGDISQAYIPIDESGINQIMDFYIRTKAQVNGNDAYGGLTINILPNDPSLDSNAQAWEHHKIGVDQDLSSSQELVVGAKCDAGEKVFIGVKSKADLNQSSHGAWGQTYECSGVWQDLRLPWAGLQPLWGTSSKSFDPSTVMRIEIQYINAVHPKDFHLSLAGIGLDSSVIDYKGPALLEYESATTQLKLPQSLGNSSIQSNFTQDSWAIQGVPSKYWNQRGSFQVYEVSGQLLVDSQVELSASFQGKFETQLQGGNFIGVLSANNEKIFSQGFSLKP